MFNFNTLDMAIFNMYTYQFSPIVEFQNGTLFDEYLQEHQNRIMLNKNTIFEEAILLRDFNYRNRNLSSQPLFNQSNVIAFRISNRKQILIEKEFVKKREINEPSTLVIIYNDNNVQRIAIEQRKEAFSDTSIVAKIIHNSVSHFLRKQELKITINKEYSQNEFWDFVESNANTIQMISFEFDYPNLPRLKSMVNEIIKDTTRSMGGDKASVKYESTNSVLRLDRDNEELDKLNKVSSDTGAPITFRLKGHREHKKTGQTSVTKEIDEMEIIANNVDDIIKILEKL